MSGIDKIRLCRLFFPAVEDIHLYYGPIDPPVHCQPKLEHLFGNFMA